MKFLLRHILFWLITLSCFLSIVNPTSLKIYSLFVLEVNGVCLRGCLNFLSSYTGFIALTTLAVRLSSCLYLLWGTLPPCFFLSERMEGKEKVGRERDIYGLITSCSHPDRGWGRSLQLKYVLLTRN